MRKIELLVNYIVDQSQKLYIPQIEFSLDEE